MLSWDEFDRKEDTSFVRSISCSVRRNDLYGSAIRRAREVIWRKYSRRSVLVGGKEQRNAYWIGRSIDPFSVYNIFDFLRDQPDRSQFVKYFNALADHAKVVVSLWLQALKVSLTSPFSAYDAELSIRRHRLRTFS